MSECLHGAPPIGSAAREATALPYAGRHRNRPVAPRRQDDDKAWRLETRAAAQAARGVALCARCEDRHFRPYPEDPGQACGAQDCECWCGRGEAP